MMFKRQWIAILIIIFIISLGMRVYGAFTFGKGLHHQYYITVINFDENGSCRSCLGYFFYPDFVGWHVVFIAKMLGYDPPVLPKADKEESYQNSNLYRHNHDEVQSYCHSGPLILIARIYSALLGAATVALLGVIALIMWPDKPRIAWTACAILGVSNFHIAQSHWGTVDAPQVFYLTLFTMVLCCWIVSRRNWLLVLSVPLLLFVIWTKDFYFAIFAYVCLIPLIKWRKISIQYYILFLCVLCIAVLFVFGWDELVEELSKRFVSLTWGDESSRFGTGHGNIGIWRRLIRNPINIILVHSVGIGFPIFIFACLGIRKAFQKKDKIPLWLAHTPVLIYFIYMLILGPITYYRYYLPLFPIVSLLAAYGLWQSRWSKNRIVIVILVLYTFILTIDSEYNYRFDPRRNLRQWYSNHSNKNILFSYYVSPPMNHRMQNLFNMDYYLKYGISYVKRFDYLILSESWYHTSFPNELNGPIAWKPEWLITTKPEHVCAYRRILRGQDKTFVLETEYNLKHFTPEFLIHRFFYGSFQRFVGDIKIFKIIK